MPPRSLVTFLRTISPVGAYSVEKPNELSGYGLDTQIVALANSGD